MTALRALRRRLLGDRGFSVIEMVVVVSILGVVLAMVQMTTIGAQKEVGGNSVRLDQLQQAKLAIESMSKTLRTSVLPSQLNATCSGCATAAAFINGDVRSVQFYANINNDTNIIGPSQVTYVVGADGKLTEKIHGPDPHDPSNYNYTYVCTTGVGCINRTRTLATHVDITQALFTYYDATGAVIVPPLTGGELAAVDSIDIVVKVKSSPKVPATSLTERVTLPNADAVAQATAT